MAGPSIIPPRPPHPGAPMQPGVGAPQGGFVPGNNYRMQKNMHDPLAYLEKTTSNVGGAGPMGHPMPR